MNGILSFVLAVLVYPGAFVALLAAWALTWGRESVRAAVSREVVPSPLREVNEIRSDLARDIVQPEGLYPWLTITASYAALLMPLLALILLPIPGNPLVQAIGLQGDVIACAALLLGVPALRLLVAWATPSPYTRLAADRGVRLLAGAVLTLTPTPTKAAQPFWWVVTHILAALAFVFVLPPLTRAVASLREGRQSQYQDLDLVSGELTELNGRDLACFRIAEALQFVAVAAYFATVFILPLFPSAFGRGHDLLWLAGLVVTALGIGAWEGFAANRPPSGDRPPLNWWLGLPVLIALFSLVTAAIAMRGS